ncbi:hypothetical protein BLTE_18840 [Blastochloris tepida]|uniref:Uncharacterized protein n=1 Tax=Blastochloris tepida TaxID=2233851 RepID=A0A348G0W6_9HYPH|nr:hypothetical protein BLTE_18840 [Blastochloris tepida]
MAVDRADLEAEPLIGGTGGVEIADAMDDVIEAENHEGIARKTEGAQDGRNIRSMRHPRAVGNLPPITDHGRPRRRRLIRIPADQAGIRIPIAENPVTE